MARQLPKSYRPSRDSTSRAVKLDQRLPGPRLQRRCDRQRESGGKRPDPAIRRARSQLASEAPHRRHSICRGERFGKARHATGEPRSRGYVKQRALYTCDARRSKWFGANEHRVHSLPHDPERTARQRSLACRNGLATWIARTAEPASRDGPTPSGTRSGADAHRTQPQPPNRDRPRPPQCQSPICRAA